MTVRCRAPTKDNVRRMMTNYEHNHYFIELLQDISPQLSSGELVAMRQERARDFVAEIRGWLERQFMSDDVSELKVTVLGRVMITCAPEVIEKINELDHPDVISVSLSSPHMVQSHVARHLA